MLKKSGVKKKGVKEKSVKEKSVKENIRKKHYVIVDFPDDNEIIYHSDYAIKIGASEADCVEISIDGGKWSLCRMSEGYWWFDWVNYPEGIHKIEARLRIKNRTVKNSIVRKCRYQLV